MKDDTVKKMLMDVKLLLALKGWSALIFQLLELEPHVDLVLRVTVEMGQNA